MSVIKNSFIYLGSSVFSKAMPFLLLPFLTKYLTKEEFGVLSIFLVFNSLYSAVVGMSIHANVTKNFFIKGKSFLAKIIGNVLIVLIISASIVGLITYVVSIIWGDVFSVPSEVLQILPLLAFLMMINQINLSVLRNQGKSYAFGLFEISNAFINLIVTMTFLVFYQFGWYSQVIGLVAANLILSFFSIAYLKRHDFLNFKWSLDKIKSILKLSLPLIPHALGSVVIAVSDRLFIERMVGLDAVAIYSVGYSFGMFVVFFVDAFVKAWSPWFYKNIAVQDSDTNKLIVKYIYIFIYGVFIAALLLSFVGITVLPFVVDERYYEAKEYVLWVALGYAFQGVYKIFFPFLVYIDKTVFLIFSTGLAVVVNCILNVVLIDEYGAIGAAYATITSFAVSAILVFNFQKRYFTKMWKPA